MNRTLCLFLLLLVAVAFVDSRASAQVFTTLHNFSDGSIVHDGISPDNIIQGSDGNLYGAAVGGGANNGGVLFKMTPSGVVTILTSLPAHFSDDDDDIPVSLTQGSDGNFYGQSENGGSAGMGAVFKMTPSGTFTILHNFGDGSVPNDGQQPEGALIQGHDGNFYGLTEEGGSAGGGTAYKITPTGTETVLHDFGDGSVAGDGQVPEQAALVQGSDGDFYGTTFYGGAIGVGSIFKITPSGSETIVHSFAGGIEESNPYGALIQARDGNFYGTTTQSVALNGGTVFKVTPTGTLTTIFTYTTGTDNLIPISALVQGPDGNLYGTTQNNLDTSSVGLDNTGTIFRLTLDGTFTPIYRFSSLSGGTPSTNNDGANPVAGLILASNGVWYGTTTNGGSAGNGTVFQLASPPSPTWNVQDVAAVSDGTARLLWDRSDGAAGIWALSVGNTKTTVGPTYGPYQGWTAQDITAAGDGTSRILWNRYDGATGVWAMDARGNQISVSPTYGPFSGWKAIDLATAPNGVSRLMWRYTNGQAGILTLNATGGEIIVGRNYGPYTGWTATAVGAAGDGTARMLWTRSDGAMGLWTMDANDLQTTVGPTYGPYSDSHGTWRATDLSTSSDGTSTVLWKRSDGAIGVWTFGANNAMTTVGAVYGPYSGFTAAALDAANDKARVLWVESNRAAGLWSFGTNDLESLIGPTYGPY